MKIVMTAVSIFSHLVPLVLPTARTLRRAGHTVAIASGESMADEVRRHGFHFIPVPRSVTAAQVLGDPDLAASFGVDLSKIGIGRDREDAYDPMFGPMFLGEPSVLFAEDLIDAVGKWGADLIVRENTEFGGYLAAEVLNLPSAVIDIAPLLTSWIPPATLVGWLNKSRVKLGLPPVADFAHSHGFLRAGVVPELLHPEQLRHPVARYYREADDRDGTPLDADVVNLPSDRPLVLATLGSIASDIPGVMSSIYEPLIEALGTLPCTAAVALGKNHDPADWSGPRPDNVHLFSYVQQRKILPSCDVFISHAGFSGVREALTAGVPMVTTPLFAEQPENSARLVELGIGLPLDPSALDAESIAMATKEVLVDPSFRNRARGMQRQILGLPLIDALADDLVTLMP